ncbi:hypothetical protein [Streptomyces sp. NPDC056983]|uniref:hypothetical protein n=1 Tax=Streptomyces sp. NPDC056983 TaxID=3345987 RepID=UPI00363D0A7C
MSPKRQDRAAPPPGPDEWDIRFAGGEAAKGWEQLGAQAVGNTRAAWHWMRPDPAPAARTERHHRLKGELARGEHRGEAVDRRQIEVTAGGRVWYLLDVTVWIDRASTGHTCIFDHYRLGGRATVRVHTGIGDDMRRDVYQDRRAYVWDNRFDTATLRYDHGPQTGSCFR